jgi:RNA polymerase sigma-70 factor, ECF subfamily
MDRERQDELDQALIRRVVEGDTAAIGELYDQYAPVMLGLSARIVGDRETAEEIVQESFVRIWRSAASYDSTRGRLGSWMMSIVHNLSLNELRRRRVRPVTQAPRPDAPEPDPADSAPGPEEITLASDSRTRIRAALNDLPQLQREVIELAYYGGFTQTEIAAKLGEPLGTVKTRVRLGMRKLADLLQGEFQEPQAG